MIIKNFDSQIYEFIQSLNVNILLKTGFINDY